MRKESTECMVDLSTEDSGLVERMLKYLYSQMYPLEAYQSPPQVRSVNDLFVDANLYAVADKYDVPRLKGHICHAFASLLDVVGTSIQLTSVSFMPEQIGIVYGTTPDSDRGLRDKLYQFVKSHRAKILGKESVQQCAKKYDGFAADLLKMLLADARSQGSYWCSTCMMYRGITLGVCDRKHKVDYS